MDGAKCFLWEYPEDAVRHLCHIKPNHMSLLSAKVCGQLCVGYGSSHFLADEREDAKFKRFGRNGNLRHVAH